MPEEEYEKALEEIKKLQDQNINKVKALNNAGKAIDSGSFANIKIDAFVTMFLNKEAQAAYVLRIEKDFQAALDEALKTVRQEQLAPNGKKGLILP